MAVIERTGSKEGVDMHNESLLINRDVFKNETSLELLFAKFITLPDIELGYIRNQSACSNIKWHTIFYYNLNEELKNKFERFCLSFGYLKIGEFIFYSHPFCPCNNPATIYVEKAIELSRFVFVEEKEFIDWFNKKEFNEGHFSNLNWCRLSKKEVLINKPFFDNMLNYIYSGYVFKDSKNNYYTPFHICDSLIYSDRGFGCSSPADLGYVMQRPFNFNN